MLWDHLADNRQILDRLLPDILTDIIPKRQELKPDKLLTQSRPKNLTQAAKKLHSNKPVILIAIIMGEKQDILEDALAAVFFV